MMQSVGLRTRSGHTGTIEYMAPELLAADSKGDFSEVCGRGKCVWEG